MKWFMNLSVKRRVLAVILSFTTVASGATACFLLTGNDAEDNTKAKGEKILVYVGEEKIEADFIKDKEEIYVSAEDVFAKADVEFNETDTQINAKGLKSLEIDKKSKTVKINDEEPEYSFKIQGDEIMISPDLLAEVVGGESVISEKEIYIIENEPVMVKFRESGKKFAFDYNDSFFLRSPFEYNHNMAKMSLGMAISAFSAKEGDDKWGKSGDHERDKDIIEFYKNMGFENIKTYNYDKSLNDDSDKVAFAIAEKDVKYAKKKYRVVALAVRGGAYGNEWVSNFNLGTGENHKGFSEAEKEVEKILKTYIGKTNGNVKLWISGFSRGAAVANLTAAKMEKALGGENIYAYTFATPNGTTAKSKNDKKYGYIYNIVSDNDLVTLFAPSEWGFGRFGRDVKFPSLAEYDEKEANEISDNMNNIYKSVAAGGEFSLMQMENANQSEKVKNAIKNLAKGFKDEKYYDKEVSGIIMDFMRINNTKVEDKKGSWRVMTPDESIDSLFKSNGKNPIANMAKETIMSRINENFGGAGEQAAVLGAICVKNGKDPYKMITEDIGISTLSTVVAVFVPEEDGGGIAKAHYSEVYTALMFGISDPDMLKIN